MGDQLFFAIFLTISVLLMNSQTQSGRDTLLLGGNKSQQMESFSNDQSHELLLSPLNAATGEMSEREQRVQLCEAPEVPEYKLRTPQILIYVSPKYTYNVRIKIK